ncbi:V-type ATP synthase subunit D [Candidatus Poribacteria bacterium]|nr:V-type ATP synthase subunit D [Candidatus Poribacteria bacterium]
MLLEVNATRMELLRLKKRLALAKRGHKLLKDKEDELMRHFLNLVNQNRDLREKLESQLIVAFKNFLMARAVMDRESMEEAIMCPKQKIDLSVSTTSIMNLRVPRFELKSEGTVHSYGLVNTSAELDSALQIYSDLLPEMVKLAETESTVKLLADEIEKTRRRVNALEYVLIPNLEETIKYITMRLNEMERSNITRLMKIKEMVQGK